MSEVVIALLLVFMGVQEYFNRIERRKLIDRIMARSLHEVTAHEVAEKAKPVEDEADPDLIPISDVNDDDFNKAIRQQLGRESVVEKAKRRLSRKAIK